MYKTVLILGGGIAGVSAAEQLRKHDSACEIILVEREDNPLYSRVLLPHYIKGVIPREKIFLKTDSWYIDQRITFLRGAEAEAIHTKKKCVHLSDGREVFYDALILATGTTPRLLSEEAVGVHYLFTLADADGICSALSAMHDDAETLVYGGGFIACEFLNILVKAKKTPTLLIQGEGFWSQALLPEGQDFLRRVVEGSGIAMHSHQGSLSLLQERGVLCGVQNAQKKTYPATFLGVGIGGEPETHIAARAGIATERGILAYEHLLTSVPDVYTAGDVAQICEAGECAPMYGNWAHAQFQGRQVGRVCAGEDSGITPPSQYTTELLGCKITFLGDTRKAFADAITYTQKEHGYSQIFLRKGICVGAILLADMTDRMHVLTLLGKPWK